MDNEFDWGQLQQDAKLATEAMPDGEYQIMVESAEATKSSNNSPMLKMRCRVIQDGPYSKRVILTNMVVAVHSGFALKLFFDRCYALGITQADFDRKITLDEIASKITGRYATAVVGHHEYQGTTRNDISMFKEPAVGTIQPDNTGGGSLTSEFASSSEIEF